MEYFQRVCPNIPTPDRIFLEPRNDRHARAKEAPDPDAQAFARIHRRSCIPNHGTGRPRTRHFPTVRSCREKVSPRGERTDLTTRARHHTFATIRDPAPARAQVPACFRGAKKSRQPQTIHSIGEGHSIRGLAAWRCEAPKLRPYPNSSWRAEEAVVCK